MKKFEAWLVISSAERREYILVALGSASMPRTSITETINNTSDNIEILEIFSGNNYEYPEHDCLSSLQT
jgi:hypothetical protein